MANVNIADLFDIEQVPNVGSFIKTVKQEICSHQIFLDEDIGEPAKYRDLINALYMANDMDEFNFFINSCGGNINSCMAIVEAVKSTSASVRAIINGEAHSAASIIALSCDEVVVTDSACMMVHTASYGTGGSTQNVKSHTDFSTVFINKILDNTYAGFLTETEMNEVKKGVELWFFAADIIERLKSRQEHLESLKNPAPVAATRKPRKATKTVPNKK